EGARCGKRSDQQMTLETSEPLRTSILGWEEAFAAGPGAVGGKGWNLGRLHRYGFRVPRGGVVAADVYDALLGGEEVEALRRQLEGVGAEQASAPDVERRLARMRELIMAAPFPDGFAEALAAFLTGTGIGEESLAVRSSATEEDSRRASFAGIHESYLNVEGTAALLEAIKSCCASLWTPRALAYRRRQG